MDALPHLWPNIGGIGVLGLALFLIYRMYRQEKVGIDAQVDTTAVALIKAMSDELGQVRERVAVLEEDKRRHSEVLQRHASWDARAVALLQQQVDPASLTALGDPLPLYPMGG